MSDPREWYILQYNGDCFIYDSIDEFPPDGDESLLIHVREVVTEEKKFALHKELESRQKRIEILTERLQDVSDMLVAKKAGSEKLLQTSMNLVRNIKKSFCGNCLVQWHDIHELARAIDRYQES